MIDGKMPMLVRSVVMGWLQNGA